MHEFKKLLVILNPAATEQAVLNKAVHIAGTQGHVTALVLSSEANADFDIALGAQLQQLRQQGYRITLEISPETDIVKAVLVAQEQHQFDLMLKERSCARLSGSLFTPTDWKLLRTHGAPVLMVRSTEHSSTAPILAAVEVQPADEEHLQLTHRILEHARWIADQLQRSLHLFSASPAPMQDLAHPDQQEQTFRASGIELGDRYGIGPEQVHIKAGPAELLIADQTKLLDAQMLVLGTVARSGLKGMLLGNTAEQVLERVDTDVLVISPVRQVS